MPWPSKPRVEAPHPSFFLVPFGICTAITVWRRMPIGYVLAAIVVVKGAAMGAGFTGVSATPSGATTSTALPRWTIHSRWTRVG